MTVHQETLSDRYAATGVPAPVTGPFADFDAPAVVAGPDFDRVDALPRAPGRVHTAPELTATLRADSGAQALRPVQALALSEAIARRGLFAPIGVGRGKTLIDFLLPVVLEAKRPLLFVPASLVKQAQRDYEAAREHWRLAPLEIRSYTALSTARGATLLDDLAPDLIVCDEAHHLKRAQSARTKRFLRYCKAHPETMVCALSGSITQRSLRDFAHLAAVCLRDGAPVPLTWHALQDWCGALDADVQWFDRRSPGALTKWCAPGESPRDGYRRRLIETPGVVATTDDPLPNGLEIARWAPRMPECARLVRECLRYGAWDGVELDPLGVARVAGELAMGFAYKWEWPGGVADTEWLLARNAWNAACRNWLQAHPDTRIDSPLALVNAVDHGPGMLSVPDWERLARKLAAWRAVSDRPEPRTVAQWYNHELRDVVARWLRSDDAPGVVWYSHVGVGEQLGAAFGNELLHIPPGHDPSTATYAPVLLLSIQAHGTGKNLQDRSRSLVLSPPKMGAAWEQLLGRMHRPGQLADTVRYDVLASSPGVAETMKAARSDAAYLEKIAGPQKLNLATWVDW